MSIVTQIEHAIIMLGPGEYQKFCDTFLSKQNKYGTILGLGMKSGTQKTTIGNPDTYFVNENGKYVFVAYTTQQNSIFSKIKDDIEKCMDPVKTGIELSYIEEIICCHTSSTLTAGDDRELRKLCEDKGIKLTLFGVDEMAQQIYNNYPSLAEDFLKISIDTKQIMTDMQFVKYNNSIESSAPLDTKFVGREEELKNLLKDIKDNTAVIINGAAGVGKTRIALEAARKFCLEEDYQLLCVKSRNLPLNNELVMKLEKPGNYLFLVDDADELPLLNLIFDYLTKKELGYNIKIVMTVRNYKKNIVIETANNYTDSKIIELSALSSDDFEKFLNVNMNINDSIYIIQMLTISEGNPMIAYLTYKAIKKSDSRMVLRDATEVYKKYYFPIMNSILGKDRKLCLTVGIIVAFNYIKTDNPDKHNLIFDIIDITENEFRDCVYSLTKKGIIETRENEVVFINDKCFANYVLYYVFYETKIISLTKFIEIGFIYFRSKVSLTINILMSIFYKKELYDYIKDIILSLWDKLENENSVYLEEFEKVFHIYNPIKSFDIAYEKINNIPQEEFSGNKLDLSNISIDNDVLVYLEGYRFSEHMENVMELFIEYVKKSEKNAVNGYNWLILNYGIDHNSAKCSFKDEKKILNKFSEYINTNKIIDRFIVSYIRYALNFKFDNNLCLSRSTYFIYNIELKDCNGVKEYRQLCWNILMEQQENTDLSEEIEDLIKYYCFNVVNCCDSSILLNDLPYIEQLISGLNCNCIKSGIIVRELYSIYDIHGIKHYDRDEIFNSEEWTLNRLLENGLCYSGLEYNEYKKEEDEAFTRYAESLNKKNIEKFVVTAKFVIENTYDEYKDDVINSTEKILEKACENTELSVLILNIIFDSNLCKYLNPNYIIPVIIKDCSYYSILEKINNSNIVNINEWMFCCFQYIPSNNIDEKIYENLIEFFRDNSDSKIDEYSYRSLRFLNKFINIDPDIYVTVCKIIYEKRNYNKIIVYNYFVLLLYDKTYSPDKLKQLFQSDMELFKNIYLFVIQNNKLLYLDRTLLSELILSNDLWIEEYIDVFYDKITTKIGGNYYDFTVLWQSDNYIKIFDMLYKKIIIEANPLYRLNLPNKFEYIFNVRDEKGEIASRQEEWVVHTIELYGQSEDVLFLFSMLISSRESLRIKAIEKLLNVNSDFQLFDKIQLCPYSYGGFIPDLIHICQNNIKFLKSLIPLVNGFKYYKHHHKIENEINIYKHHIKKHELTEMLDEIENK